MGGLDVTVGPGTAVDTRKVFVVHGRNEPARKGLFDFLRSIGLDPIEWSEAIRLTGKGSPHIGEVLDAADAPGDPDALVEPEDDMVIVTSPCHRYEPVKVPSHATGRLHCLVCGDPFAV